MDFQALLLPILGGKASHGLVWPIHVRLGTSRFALAPLVGVKDAHALILPLCVPFMNRPFESEIHVTVNFATFCCVLLVTWCHRVCFSCYLPPK